MKVKEKECIFEQEKMEKLKESEKQWEEGPLLNEISHHLERAPRFSTISDLEIKRLYTPSDIPDFDYLRDLNFPGCYPFTRGIHTTMYRGRLWTMRQFAGFGTPEQTNERFKYLLSIAFDFPTLYGRDSDDPNDMLKEFIAQKTWIYPPFPSLRLVRDIVVYCIHHVPKWNTISIFGYHIREAGATAVQELAFTITDGIEYVKMGIEAGLDVDAFAPRYSFFFDSHMDFL